MNVDDNRVRRCAARPSPSFASDGPGPSLVSLLDSHPDVRCYGELFAPRYGAPEEGFVFSQQDDPRLYVTELVSGCDETAIGFKLDHGAIQAHPNAVAVLNDAELRVVRLTRDHLLVQDVSGILAYKTEVWRQRTGEESYGGMTHRVDPAKCVRALANLEARDRRMDQLAEGHPVMRLTYEQLVAGSRIEEVQRFLGVRPRSLSSHHHKLRTRPLRETIENWNELSAELRGTRFERFLVEESLSADRRE